MPAVRSPIRGPSLAVLPLTLALGALVHPVRGQAIFARSQIDAISGDVKCVADIDRDGKLDVVLGGDPVEGLHWYHFPEWTSTHIATPAIEFSTDGECGDVDGDGDIDIVVPDGPDGDNLLWFENPLRSPSGPPGDPFVGVQWQRHVIGAIGGWGKDVELADFDGDGQLDVATRDDTSVYVFFQDNASWTRVQIAAASTGHEGMTSGDLDADGNVDLVIQGAWLRDPGGSAARDGQLWTESVIATSGVDPDFKALCADVDGDGVLDVLYSSSENIADVLWFGHTGPATGAWMPHLISAGLDRVHTLQVADIDGDGSNDVVLGQMHTSSSPGIHVHYNLDGRGLLWKTVQVDSQFGIHNGVAADLDGDGDTDIVGSAWTGNPPLQLWNNETQDIREDLAVPELREGVPAVVHVGGAAAGMPVFLGLSVLGAADPYRLALLGVDYRLVDPLLVGFGIADAGGAADFPLVFPAGLAGLQLWFQSCEPGRASRVVRSAILH
ncbi:MAG: VCBS repeat-containing protein [Planctomycetota bacterium]